MTREDAEHNRQEIIRGMMQDGLTREQAEEKERVQFQRAFAKLTRSLR